MRQETWKTYTVEVLQGARHRLLSRVTGVKDKQLDIARKTVHDAMGCKVKHVCTYPFHKCDGGYTLVVTQEDSE